MQLQTEMQTHLLTIVWLAKWMLRKSTNYCKCQEAWAARGNEALSVGMVQVPFWVYFCFSSESPL